MPRENLFTLLKGNSPQLIAVFFGTLNALSDGMHFGWTAPTIPILQKEGSPIKVTSSDIMKLEVYYMIFGIVGLPITIFLADKIGRQKSVLLASSTSLVGWILIGIADRVEYFIVARCLVGVAGDVAFVCSPMYVAEIAHQKIRGFLAGIIYTMVLIGVLVIYVIAPYTSIRIPPLVGGSIIIVQLVVFPFMPESPYYHLFKNNEIAAKKSLQRLRGNLDVQEELEEISAAIRRQKMEKGRLLDLFIIDSNRKAIFIMTILNCIQNMVGFTAILMNFHNILDEAGATYLDSQVSAIIFASVMVIASLVAMLSVDKFGRRKLYGFSCLFSGLSLLTMAIYYNMKYSGYDVHAASWIPLAFLMLFAAFFKFGIGIIPIVMTAELFPAKVKALGMTAADGIFVAFASLSVYIYQTLNESYGLHASFYLFSSVAFSGLIFNLFMLPETKNKTLEEIQMMLKS
ncbi:facilitated trehalose transporter Tret1-like [Coccinella septempunctata]|uniref:facilitated trehalose transporter Tret1-like n=1 Tax=Coccinella septempunctata TaxID=41139 RepID=UPI001D074824|nr:facilitated trehalose transporter Tret1-like [Coccinella septempunctata]